MLEVITSNPCSSVHLVVLIVPELGDQVITGLGNPLAVQLNSAVSPSLNFMFTLAEGFVIEGESEIKNHSITTNMDNTESNNIFSYEAT